MGVPCFPDLVAVCSLNADKTFVNAFIMEASIDNSTREYVLSQKGPIVEDMLNMLHRTLNANALAHPLRRHVLYLLRTLAYRNRQFPRDLVLAANTIQMNFTKPVKATGFANIYQGKHNGKLVAVKEIKLAHEEQYHIFREASSWAQLSHPNVARMLGVMYHDSRPDLPLLVSPWMQNGTLRDYMMAKEHYKKHKMRRPLAQQIAEAIAYLHGQKTFHGDIKDTNILISDSYNALLTDFGLASVGDVTLGQFTGTSVRGTKAWMSPERFNPSLKDRTAAMDVYAYGLICYMLAKGEPIFAPKRPQDDPEGEAVAKRVQNGDRPPRFEKCYDGSVLEPSFWDMIIFCWDAIPARRLSMRNVLAYFDIPLSALAELDAAQFTTYSTVTCTKSSDHKSMLGLSYGEPLSITDWTAEKWTARRYNGEVGHVLPSQTHDVIQFYGVVTQLPNTKANPTKMRRLSVVVGEVVDVVAVASSWWLVRNINKVMGVIEPQCLRPEWPDFTPTLAATLTVALFPYTPSNCPHAVPLKTAARVLAWSYHANDTWRVVKYSVKDKDDVIGLVPAHYLEPANKRPRLLEDVKVICSTKKKKN